MSRRSHIVLAAAVVMLLSASGAAMAASLPEAVSSSLPPAIEAEAEARGGNPTSVQAAYDAARDLREAVAKASPGPPACASLVRHAIALADALVAEQEGFDRPSPGDRSRAAGTISLLQSRVAADARTCSSRPRTTLPTVPMRPSSGEAFFGAIVAGAPADAKRAVIDVGGHVWRDVPITAAQVRVEATGAPRSYDFAITFKNAAGASVGVAHTDGAWLLPRSGQVAVAARRADVDLAAELGSIAKDSPGAASIWTQDLRTGRYAGANAGARFPAASTVKLGLLAGVVHRLGAAPERSPFWYDLRQVGGWSSNLAANRLVERLGSGCGGSGERLASEGLRLLGAKYSTYPGCYIVGTELQPQMPDAPATDSPVLNTQRVTTAQDLGRMMFALQASAVGMPGTRGETGLSQKQARQILGLLLASQQVGDNQSLVAGGVPRGTPIAQKNGWLGNARLSASIAYLPTGPVIVTVAEQSSGGVSLAAGQTLGRRAMAAAIRAFNTP